MEPRFIHTILMVESQREEEREHILLSQVWDTRERTLVSIHFKHIVARVTKEIRLASGYHEKEIIGWVPPVSSRGEGGLIEWRMPCILPMRIGDVTSC